MKDEEIFEKVREIILDRLDVKMEEVTMEALFLEDLGADSLELTELVLAVEEEFSCKIPDVEIENLRSVHKVVSFVKSRLSQS